MKRKFHEHPAGVGGWERLGTACGTYCRRVAIPAGQGRGGGQLLGAGVTHFTDFP